MADFPVRWVVGLWLLLCIALLATNRPERPLKFLFDDGTTALTENRAVAIVRSGRGREELVVVLENNRSTGDSLWSCDVHVWEHDYSLSTARLLRVPGQLVAVSPRDVDFDGDDELAVSCANPDAYTEFMILYDLPSFNEMWRIAIPVDSVPCRGREFDGALAAGPVIASAAGDTSGLLIVANAGYCLYPRGISMVNALNGRQEWFTGIAPSVCAGEIELVDVNHDGREEILAFGYAPQNGATYDDLADSMSQIILLSEDGIVRWRRVWPHRFSGAYAWLPADDDSRFAIVYRYNGGAPNTVCKINLATGETLDSVDFKEHPTDPFLWPLFTDSSRRQLLLAAADDHHCEVIDEDLQRVARFNIPGRLRQALDLDGDGVNEFVAQSNTAHVLVDSAMTPIADFERLVGSIVIQHGPENRAILWIDSDAGLWRTFLFPNPDFDNWKQTMIGRYALWILLSLMLAAICVGSIFLYDRNRRMATEKVKNDAGMRAADAVMRHVHHVLDTPLDAIGFSVSNAGHELRHRAPELDPILTRLVNSIQDRLNQCRKSIETVRRFADPTRYVFEDVELHALVVDTLAERFAQRKGITEIVDRSGRNRFSIRGDRMQLEELVICIFRNAQTAMRDTEAPRFEFSVDSVPPPPFEAKEEHVYLMFRDNGRGMNKEQLSLAFENGYSDWGGSGFGLAFVKATAEGHGGTVLTIQSVEGQGTMFVVAFPRTGAQA